MRSTGQIISQTVKNLLAEAVSEDRDALATRSPRKVYTEKQDALADFMGVSRPYMPRKIEAGTWDAVDLDKLASYFHLYPVDFVPCSNDDWEPSEEPLQDAPDAAKLKQGGTSGGNGPDNDSPGVDSKKTE